MGAKGDDRRGKWGGWRSSRPDEETRSLGQPALPLVKRQELVRPLHLSRRNVQQVERADAKAHGMGAR